MKKNCECEVCKSYCVRRPGWFAPDQIEDLKKHFKVKDIKGLLDTGKLAIDWWEEEVPVLVLAPNIIGNDEIYYPADPRSQCVFYKNGLCSIHKIKPFECRESHHDNNHSAKLHEKAADKWRENKILEKFRDQVEVEPMDMFSSMLGLW